MMMEKGKKFLLREKENVPWRDFFTSRKLSSRSARRDWIFFLAPTSSAMSQARITSTVCIPAERLVTIARLRWDRFRGKRRVCGLLVYYVYFGGGGGEDMYLQ